MFARGLRSQSTCARASRPVDAGPQKNNKPCMSEIGTCRGKLCAQHLFKCALGLELDMNIWWALALSATSRTLYKEGASLGRNPSHKNQSTRTVRARHLSQRLTV